MRRLRFSIAGLMGIVLIAALGLSALREASPIWLGAMYLLSRGVLALAVLPAIYRRGAARAWWLGFCLFGWGYLYLIETRVAPRDQSYPTSHASLAVRTLFGHRATSNPPGPDEEWFNYYFVSIGHSVWAIMAALLGAVLVRMIAVRSGDRTRPGDAPPPTAGPPPGRRWIRPALVGWAGLVLVTAAATIRAPGNGGFWAGATFLLTLGLLGMAGVGAVCTRGPRRNAWLGAALLGGGYFFLVFTNSRFLPLPAGRLLEAVKVKILATHGAADRANARILEVLERPIPMRFPEPTPLEDVLKHIRKATATPRSPGLPIYLDPIGLREAEQSATSTVTIDLEEVPLKASLRACLDPIHVTYIVKEGYILVTSPDSAFYQEDLYRETANRYGACFTEGISANIDDSYLIAAHCLLALVAAGIGAVAGPMIAGASLRSDLSTERA